MTSGQFGKGRVGRSNFLLFLVGLALAWIAGEYYVHSRLNLMFNIGFRSNVAQWGSQSIELTALQIASDILLAFFTVRRLHDANKSGWIWLGILAFALAGTIHFGFSLVALIGLIIIVFLPGTIGPNDYGADPRGWKSREQFDAQKKMLAEEQNK